MNHLIPPTPLPTPDELNAFGYALSRILRVGDLVTLRGELGSGKTSLSRAIIQGLGVDEDVPSPTYTLVQTYLAPEFEIWHFDLYRLEVEQDFWALGIEEALERGVSLIEWPERIHSLLSGSELDLQLEFADTGRILTAKGNSKWKERLANVET